MTKTNLQNILIFSLDPIFGNSIAKVLGDKDYAFDISCYLEEVLEKAIKNEFNLVIFDTEDLDEFKRKSTEIIQELYSRTPILLINPSPDLKRLYKDAENRCSFLFRPFRTQQVIYAVRTLLSKETPFKPTSKILGESEPMLWMKSLLQRVAPLDSHVMIIGQSGSGKNLVADEIQRLSLRCRDSYMKISCLGVPENLLYQDLFGDEKDELKIGLDNIQGKLGLANNGTILLDDISELPENIQARLVTALEREDGNLYGVDKPGTSNFRILVTSKEDIYSLVEKNKFREDLYFRLNFISIYVPPLRDRLEDVPLLIESFLPGVNEKLGTNIVGVSREAMGLLYSYTWPGNVRELKNVLERAALFEDGEILQEQQIQKAFQAPASQNLHSSVMPELRESINREGINLKETLQVVEKKLIEKALLKTDGVQTEAARILGLKAKNLWKKMQKYEISSSKLVSFPSREPKSLNDREFRKKMIQT